MQIRIWIRQHLLSLFKFIEGKAKKIHYLLLEKDDAKMDYTSLSPIANGDENGNYGKALLWALKNRSSEDIKNIALTGPYGSGKSSILKTFQERYLGNDLKFLNISLATFKEEKIKKDADGNLIETDKTELLRLIEVSILQQIFYHEEDRKIPDSRFKKIKSYSAKKLFFYALAYSLFLLAVLDVFFPYMVQGTFKDFPFSAFGCDVLFYASRAIIITGIFWVIFKSIRVISAITLNKLTIQDAEFGLGDNINKSILNHHIDEILYFFSVRPYNVVVIEDLDRFQETEIFTKLREINLLLNNSRKTKRKEIVFIYAVRDEMFADKDRTKFFDFIIPVIPIINSSNSSNIILGKKKIFGYSLSDTFIEDIGYYIDDMRLLHNINNEFYLYKLKLNENLVQDKLFAIIVYKNIHPGDFVKLSYNEGELFKILNSKAIYIREQADLLEKTIEVLRDEIKLLSNVYARHIKELRSVYVLKALEGLPRLDSFLVAGNVISFEELAEDKNFEYLRTDRLKYNNRTIDYYNRRETLTTTDLNITFADLEKKVNPKKAYVVREKELVDLESDRINVLKVKIQDLEKEKAAVRKFNIAQLVLDGVDLGIKKECGLNIAFVDMALRNSYIAEDYLDYISLFHEGSITRADYQFKINLRNRAIGEFDYKLNRIDKLILQINPLDFENHFILNYNLVDFLLENKDAYEKELTAIFGVLKDGSELSLKFIKGFLKDGVGIALFLDYICRYWAGFWGFVESGTDFTEVQQDQMLILMIRSVNTSSFKSLAVNSGLERRLENDNDTLSSVNDEQILKDLITVLDLKFANLDLSAFSDDINAFIYEGDHYQINIHMVSSLILMFGDWDQVNFDVSNFKAVKTSGCDQLIVYLTDYIDDYVTNIYLQIVSNNAEEEPYYIELLKSEYLAHDYALKVIDQVKTKVTRLSDLEDTVIVKYLLAKDKVAPNWENLLYDFQISDSTVSAESINFINVLDNAKALSLVKMPLKVEEKDIFSPFCRALLTTNGISEEAFEHISKSSPWWFSNLEIENISSEKARSLVNNRDIEPVKKSFDALKEHHPGQNIRLLELYKKSLLDKLDELEFDAPDIELVLPSVLLSNPEKMRILKRCDEAEVVANKKIMVGLGQMMLDDHTLDLSDALKVELLNCQWISHLNRINLLLIQGISNHERINVFLENLGGEYAKISDATKRPSFADHSIIRQFLEKLVRIKYISSISEKRGVLKVYHKTR